MSDRELLELAAKAAEMDYLVWTPGSSPIVPAEKRIGGRMAWNPIHNDGDALRLAIKVGLLIDGASQCARPLPDELGWFDGNPSDDDASATRRAIVRAAAEIAKAREA